MHWERGLGVRRRQRLSVTGHPHQLAERISGRSKRNVSGHKSNKEHCTMSDRPMVGIVMGSDTDLPVMTETAATLKKFGVPFEVEITSAHRSPARTSEYARSAIERGLKVIIVGAGGASHLAGIIA